MVAGVVIFDAILKLVFRVVLYQFIYNSSKHIIIIHFFSNKNLIYYMMVLIVSICFAILDVSMSEIGMSSEMLFTTAMVMHIVNSVHAIATVCWNIAGHDHSGTRQNNTNLERNA